MIATLAVPAAQEKVYRHHLSWTGAMTALWGMASAAAAGALLGSLVMIGRLHPDGIPTVGTMAAAVFGALGILHGATLAHLGRPAGMPAYDLVDRLLVTGAALAALGVGVLVAFWTILAAAIARSGDLTGWLVLLSLLGVTGIMVAYATVRGWQAMETAFARWPDHRLGSWLILGTWAVVCSTFMVLQPAFPGTGLQPNAIGCLLLGAVVTVWVGAPAVVLGLRIAHRRWRTR